MLKTTLRADESTEILPAIAQLRNECKEAGLDEATTDALALQTSEILVQLVEKGKQLASMGSQMNVTRMVSGDKYAIRIVFGAGVRQSLLDRILSIFKVR